jgi:hypothetical protein
MVDALGHEPAKYVSADTAHDLALAAYRRAVRACGVALRSALRCAQACERCCHTRALTGRVRAFSQLRLAPPGADVAGVALTGALATGAPKRGAHACHVVARTRRGTTHASLTLHKGARDRFSEDALVSALLLSSLARACGVDDAAATAALAPQLTPGDALESDETAFSDPLGALLASAGASASASAGAPPSTTSPVSVLQLRGGLDVGAVGAASPRVLLPGSFNPLHAGHAALLAAACAACGGAPGGYELSVTNADKGALPRAEIERRAAQFGPDAPPLVLTDAPLFVHKAALLPGTTFVVGIDTAVRIVMPKYYAGGDEAAMRAVLQAILDAGCSFLVAGRLVGDTFLEPTAVTAPPGMEGAWPGSCDVVAAAVSVWMVLTRARGVHCVARACRAVSFAAIVPAGHLLLRAARARGGGDGKCAGGGAVMAARMPPCCTCSAECYDRYTHFLVAHTRSCLTRHPAHVNR